MKQLIMSDAFVDGRIPSETDLASDLCVSRTTIRDASAAFEIEGVIYRKQGVRNIRQRSRAVQIKSRLDEIWSYEGMLAAHGYTPSTEILNISIQAADEDIATTLNLPVNESVLVVKKLFLADGQPVILRLQPHSRQTHFPAIQRR
ncbi:MAG: GntR family transcriptional regulator [Chloroflexota bacterium]